MALISAQGLILHKQKFKENSSILTIFTAEQGLLKGVCNGATSKKNLYKLQLGNLIDFEWRARLESHLGTFTRVDLKHSAFATVFTQPLKLLMLTSVCSLLSSLLVEKDSMPTLYKATSAFLEQLKSQSVAYYEYLEWENHFLREMGFGLHLSRCAVCHKSHEEVVLPYVSPKTGSAVCEIHAAPYIERLLLMPAFALSSGFKSLPTGAHGSPNLVSNSQNLEDLEHNPNQQSEKLEQHRALVVQSCIALKEGLDFNGHFLHKMFSHFSKAVPAARARLLESVAKKQLKHPLNIK